MVASVLECFVQHKKLPDNNIKQLYNKKELSKNDQIIIHLHQSTNGYIHTMKILVCTQSFFCVFFLLICSFRWCRQVVLCLFCIFHSCMFFIYFFSFTIDFSRPVNSIIIPSLSDHFIKYFTYNFVGTILVNYWGVWCLITTYLQCWFRRIEFCLQTLHQIN